MRDLAKLIQTIKYLEKTECFLNNLVSFFILKFPLTTSPTVVTSMVMTFSELFVLASWNTQTFAKVTISSQ